LDLSEQIVAIILRFAEHSSRHLDGFCEDYRFLCEELVLPEEVNFRRYGRYRLASFADAYREVYSNDEIMRRYMAGLLVSNVLWDPHARAIESYVNRYLPSLGAGSDHLEIGPGHGLLLYFAASQSTLGSATGWDISPTSIAQTEDALSIMEVRRPVELKVQNLFHRDPREGRTFDSIVMSELIEHLEDPPGALRSVRELLRPDGRLWINVPVNSPAPDHIYLLPTPEEACQLFETAGFEVIDREFFPVSGSTLERARRHQLSITCVITAKVRGR
jgi:SAM-dependent methyltransferase